MSNEETKLSELEQKIRLQVVGELRSRLRKIENQFLNSISDCGLHQNHPLSSLVFEENTVGAALSRLVADIEETLTPRWVESAFTRIAEESRRFLYDESEELESTIEDEDEEGDFEEEEEEDDPVLSGITGTYKVYGAKIVLKRGKRQLTIPVRRSTPSLLRETKKFFGVS